MIYIQGTDKKYGTNGNIIIRSETLGEGTGVRVSHTGKVEYDGVSIEDFALGIDFAPNSEGELTDVAFWRNVQALAANNSKVCLKNCSVNEAILRDLKGNFRELHIIDEKHLTVAFAAVLAAPKMQRLTVLRNSPVGKILSPKGFMELVRFIDLAIRLGERFGITPETIKEFFEDLMS